MQSQASSSHVLHFLKISWLYVKNCDQNRGSNVFRREKIKLTFAKPLQLLVLHMQSQARSTHPLHCLEISCLYVENCDQNRGSKVFREEKKMALAKHILIASTPYAITSEVYPPFTLSGNFMVIRGKLRPESWVKGFQVRKKNWRLQSVLWLLVFHMQSQARSTHPLHCLGISWLSVKNCDQNRGSKVFREEKKIGAREAFFDC